MRFSLKTFMVFIALVAFIAWLRPTVDWRPAYYELMGGWHIGCRDDHVLFGYYRHDPKSGFYRKYGGVVIVFDYHFRLQETDMSGG